MLALLFPLTRAPLPASIGNQAARTPKRSWLDREQASNTTSRPRPAGLADVFLFERRFFLTRAAASSPQETQVVLRLNLFHQQSDSDAVFRLAENGRSCAPPTLLPPRDRTPPGHGKRLPTPPVKERGEAPAHLLQVKAMMHRTNHPWRGLPVGVSTEIYDRGGYAEYQLKSPPRIFALFVVVAAQGEWSRG